MKSRLPTIAVLLFCAGHLLAPAATVMAKQPNIVFVISDDMGYSDLGCYGGEIDTPVLDGLAQRGLRFTNYYVNNMCWPTRASLMTGLYPRVALPNGSSSTGGLHSQSMTLARVLQNAGYSTFMSGKWHLSNSRNPDGKNAPHHRGFDQFYGTIEGASDFFAPADLQLNGKSMTHQWEGKDDYYYTDSITDHALKFLENRDREKPFFLYLAYTAAHWPLHAKPEDIEHYRGRFHMGWDQLRRDRHQRMKELGVVDPSWELSPRHSNVPAWPAAKYPLWHERRMEVYAAQITCMDRNIGRVTDYLENNGLSKDTIVVYQHDNGGCHVEYLPERKGSWTREHTTDGSQTPVQPGNIPNLMPGGQETFQSYGYGWANASNTPFRLFKQYDHEGGTRSPLIIHWPQGIAERLQGSLIKEVCHVIDIMPTMLEVAGVSWAAQKPLPMEGRSFANAMRGEPVSQHDAIFWAHNKGAAVWSDGWKLVSDDRGKNWELYYLPEDGTELKNLASQNPEKVAALRDLHAKWMARNKQAARSATKQ